MAFNSYAALAPRRQTYLSPEEEESLLAQLGNSALSGLSLVGNILDTPGAFVRTALAGENPFPGIFDPSQRVEGRELLEQWGLLDANQEGFHPIDHPADALGDVGGFAAEVLLDPLTYLTLGGSALTKAGRVASKAGVLPRATYGAGGALTTGARQARITSTLDDILAASPELRPALEQAARGSGVLPVNEDVMGGLLQQPLGGLFGIGGPFMDPIAVLGTGPTAAKIAGKLDTAGDFLRYGNPVGRTLGALFDAPTLDTLSRAGQTEAPGVYDAARAAEAGARERLIPYIRQLEDAGLLGDNFADNQTMIGYLEGTLSPSELGRLGLGDTPHLRRFEDLVAQSGTLESGASLSPEVASVYDALAQRGYTVTRNPDVTEGAFGQLVAPGPVFTVSGSATVPSWAGTKPALDAFRRELDTLLERQQASGLPVEALDDAFADYLPRQLTDFAKSRGVRRKVYQTADPFQRGREEILKDIPGGTNLLNELSLDPFLSGPARLAPNNAAAASALVLSGIDPSKAENLADWLWKLDPQHVESVAAGAPVPAFGNNPAQNILSRVTSGEKAIAATNGVFEMLKKNVSVGGPGTVSIEETLAKSGFAAPNAPGNWPAANRLTQGARDRLAATGLAGQFIPQDIAADVGRMIKGFDSPEAVEGVLRGIDQYTNLFKSGVTSLWPSFHVRNLSSGQFMNWVGGLFSGQSYADAHDVLTKADHVITGAESIPMLAGRSLSPEQATEEILNQAFIHKVLERHSGAAADISGPTRSGAGLLAEIPGSKPLPSIAETLKSAIPGSLEEANPLNIRGVAANEDIFAPIRAGRTVGYYVEGVNRLAPFIEAMKQGYSPSAAASRVRALQVDYTRLSNTERAVMRRLLPFYSYLRGAVPEVVGEIMQRPGGKVAQYARFANEIRSEPDAFMPDYLQGGLAAPIGQEQDGTQSFLTQIDMPPEAVFEMLHGGPNAFSESGLEALGMLNPLIKGPLEMMVGKQFFSGRDTRDLYSKTGVPVLDQLLANSPASKLFSVAGQLAQIPEGRKDPLELGVNLLTGARISDVDLDKARSIQSRELIEDMLRGEEGAYMFDRLAVPDEVLATLSPEKQAAFRYYQQEGAKAAKRKKQERIGVRTSG